MKVKELLEKTEWHLVTEDLDLDKEIKGAYVGDLLSWVMGNGEPEAAWVTVQIHTNVVAVALLREFSCVIVADNAVINEEMLNAAKDENLILIESKVSAFDTCKKLVELGL